MRTATETKRRSRGVLVVKRQGGGGGEQSEHGCWGYVADCVRGFVAVLGLAREGVANGGHFNFCSSSSSSFGVRLGSSVQSSWCFLVHRNLVSLTTEAHSSLARYSVRTLCLSAVLAAVPVTR